MAPRRPPPSHYAVLGLQPHMLLVPSTVTGNTSSSSSGGLSSAAIVRKAYRRALLRYHPDRTKKEGGRLSPATCTNSAATAFTIDQITEAAAVLSDTARRRAYDRELANASTLTSSELGPGVGPPSGNAATGLEIVDLDDLDYDEATNQWTRSCRCGNARGFVVGEADLEAELEAERGLGLEAAPAAVVPPPTSGELLVGCQDCSLWLCVHFAVADDEDG